MIVWVIKNIENVTAHSLYQEGGMIDIKRDAGDNVIIADAGTTFQLTDALNGPPSPLAPFALSGRGGKERTVGNDSAKVLRGGGGQDRLIAGDGEDTLNGLGGNVTLKDDAGDDVFIFSGSHGGDRINRFDATSTGEVLDVSNITSLNRFADVAAAATQLGGIVMIATSANSSIQLAGVNLSDLDAVNFIFQKRRHILKKVAHVFDLSACPRQTLATL